jgi:prolipoprotein diacylglyceryl transferase
MVRWRLQLSSSSDWPSQRFGVTANAPHYVKSIDSIFLLPFAPFLSLIASIPAPPSGVLEIGPISLHAYGLCIALGVVAAVWLSSKRWVRAGGTSDDITAVATWGVPAGVVGARLYHVITDYELYTDNPWEALEVWDGGLGIWGGIAAGVLAGLWVGRRRGLALLPLMDAVAPGLALGQAIGRFGNYFNQELFGRPTGLPWALEVDVDHRPSEFLQFATFHPTFLYESLWNLSVVTFIVVIGPRLRLRPGSIFAVYVMGYTLGRFLVERLRIDQTHHILGLRLNEWTSIVVFAVAAAFLFVNQRRRSPTAGTQDDEMLA